MMTIVVENISTIAWSRIDSFISVDSYDDDCWILISVKC